MKLLLVEDNESIAQSIMYFLNKKHDESVWCRDFGDAKKQLSADDSFDIAILDIALPDGNGFSLYEQLVSAKGIPAIFLTARDDEDDVVKGLTLGADDYVTKPFSIKELYARITKIVSRNKVLSKITVADITFDMERMEASKDKKVIELSSLELKLLALLFENINRVVSRNTILDRIWDWTGNDVDDHTVTVYIRRIREKLGTNIITTVKGIGYRIDKL